MQGNLGGCKMRLIDADMLELTYRRMKDDGITGGFASTTYNEMLKALMDAPSLSPDVKDFMIRPDLTYDFQAK